MTGLPHPPAAEHDVRPPRSTRRRRWAGVAVGVVVLAVVVVPAFWTTVLTYSSFSGCFLECSRPTPLTGTVWLGITVVLLGCPMAAGLMTAGVRGRRSWAIALCVPLLLIGSFGLVQLVR